MKRSFLKIFSTFAFAKAIALNRHNTCESTNGRYGQKYEKGLISSNQTETFHVADRRLSKFAFHFVSCSSDISITRLE